MVKKSAYGRNTWKGGIPLGDTRYVLRISKFVILTYKNNNNFIIILSHPAYCTALLLAKKFMM